MESLGEATLILKTDGEGLTHGIASAKVSTEGLTGSFLTAQLGAQAIAKVAGVAFDMVKGALIAVTTQAANYGDEMLAASQKTGVGVAELTKLKFAAAAGNASFEDLSTGLKFLGKNIDAANQGSDSQRQSFERLGIATKDVDGKNRDLNAVFHDVAERFQEMPDGAEKSALAMQLFGKSGTDLIPTLNEGTEGLRMMGEQAEALGLVLSQEDAVAADAFNDSLEGLKGAAMGLGLQIGKALLPTLTMAANAITGVVAITIAWLKANKPLIDGLVDLGRNIGVVLIDFVARAIESITLMIDVAATVAYALGMDGLAGKLETAAKFGHGLALGIKTANDKMADSFYKTTDLKKVTTEYTATIVDTTEKVKKNEEAHSKLVDTMIKAQTESKKLADKGIADSDRYFNNINTLQAKYLNDLAHQSVEELAHFKKLDDTLTAFEKKMRDEALDFARDTTAVFKGETDKAEDYSKERAGMVVDDLEKASKGVKDHAKIMQDAFSTAMGNITSGIATGLADAIFSGKNFKDSMIGVAQEAASGMLSAFLTGLLSPLTSALAGLGQSLAGMLTGLFTGGGGGGASSAVTGGLLDKALGSFGGKAGVSGLFAGFVGPGSLLGTFGSTTTAVGGGVTTVAPSGLLGGLGSLFTNPWTAVVAAGIIGTAAWLKSQAHHEANTFVQKFQNPFHDQLAAIVDSWNAAFAAGNVDAKAGQGVWDLTHALWQNFLDQGDAFALGGKDEARVWGQAKNHLGPLMVGIFDKMKGQLATLKAAAGLATPNDQTFDDAMRRLAGTVPPPSTTLTISDRGGNPFADRLPSPTALGELAIVGGTNPGYAPRTTVSAVPQTQPPGAQVSRAGGDIHFTGPITVKADNPNEFIRELKEMIKTNMGGLGDAIMDAV